jgi:hypothetical protein
MFENYGRVLLFPFKIMLLLVGNVWPLSPVVGWLERSSGALTLS